MQKTLIYIDINTKRHIGVTGEFIDRVSDYPVIERGQWQILCFQFVNRTVDEYGIYDMPPASLSQNTSYIAVGDSNFSDTDALMIKSIQSTIQFDETDPLSNRINIEGDWIDGTTAVLADGQLSVRVNADTVKFTEVLAESERVIEGLRIYIKQYIQGLSNPSTIATLPFVALNTVRDWSSTEEATPEGIIAAPFINAAFANPIEFQFSTNAVEWHEEQSASDIYYRQRLANLNGEWSTPIKFVLGGGGSGSTDAADIIISAESQFYAGMDVASALQLIGADLDGLATELEGI